MSFGKILKAVIISVLISAGLYFGINKDILSFSEDIDNLLKTKFDLKVCIIIGISLFVYNLIWNYREKGVKMEDLPRVRQEYLVGLMNEEQKLQFNGLDNDGKEEFLSEFEDSLKQEEKENLKSYLFYAPKEYVPGLFKFLRLASFIALCYFGYTYGNEVYTEFQPLWTEHMEYVNRTINDQTLYIDGLPPIVLRGDGELKQKDVDYFIDKNIKTQPHFLLKNCNAIYLYSDNFYKKVNGNSLASGAYSDSGTMSIYINLDMHWSDKITMPHELSHIFDYKYGVHWASNSSQFKKLAKQYCNSLNALESNYDYCVKTSEFFAETSRLFLTEPEYLQKSAPELYDYFKELYK